MAARVVVDNTEALHFRAMWKKPNSKAARNEYYCSSVRELALLLYEGDGITHESIEYLYVHQMMKDSAVIEIIAIDKKSSPNINPHFIRSEPEVAPGLLKRLAGYLLAKPDKPVTHVTEGKPHIKIAAEPGLVTAGFGYRSYPAKPHSMEATK